MPYQYPLERLSMQNLATISAAGVPEVNAYEYNTRAPYTICGLGALMLGSFVRDHEKNEAHVTASYDPAQKSLDAMITLSKPASHIVINRGEVPRTVIELSSPLHGLAFRVQEGQSGLSLFDETMDTYTVPMRPVDDAMFAHAIDGLALRTSGKLANYHAAGGTFETAHTSATLSPSV